MVDTRKVVQARDVAYSDKKNKVRRTVLTAFGE